MAGGGRDADDNPLILPNASRFHTAREAHAGIPVAEIEAFTKKGPGMPGPLSENEEQLTSGWSESR